MHLDKLAVGVFRPLLIHRAGRRAGVHHGIGRAVVDNARPAGRQNDGVGPELLNGHGAQILGDDALADAVLVPDDAQELPELILFDLAVHFRPPRLLVQRIQQLLPRRRARIGRPVVLGAAEPPEIQQAFAGAVKHDPHAVQQIDNAGRMVAHMLDRRLVGEKVAAVNRVVQMLIGRIALAFRIDRAVDAALSADRMAALDGNKREQVYRNACLGNFHRRHQPGQSAADHNHFRLRITGNCRHRSNLTF